MTKQQQKDNNKMMEKENALPFRMEKGSQIKRGYDPETPNNSDDKRNMENRNGSDQKIPRNAFLKLDLDAIALRMKKDLTDRCCCADVPCVSIVKEYCESR